MADEELRSKIGKIMMQFAEGAITEEEGINAIIYSFTNGGFAIFKEGTDYSWCDGSEEYSFDSFEEASNFYRSQGNRGKVWRRHWKEGNLEGVTLIVD